MKEIILLLEKSLKSIETLSKTNGDAAICRRDTYLALEKIKAIDQGVQNLNIDMIENTSDLRNVVEKIEAIFIPVD